MRKKILMEGKIGSLKIKNRIVMAPMNLGGLNDSDGCLSKRGIGYFLERAKGGTGLITTGAVRVSREFERDQKTIPLWMLFADHMIHVKWMSELAEKCHDYNAKVAVQLTAGGGRQAGEYAQTHDLAIGPSENRCFYPPYKNTRPLTQLEIKKLIKSFGKSSINVKNAGIDAIQLHGHEGYLLDQFSSPLWNRRTDEYGGSLEGRLRFIKEIICEIKSSVGSDFPIIYRFGLSHYIEGGRNEEEGIEMAKLLQEFGVDALDIDAGCYENWYLPHPPSTIPPGKFEYCSAKVKKTVEIPVISSARIGYPDVAEQILNNNSADFISLGRPLIADPYWVSKVENGEENDIRPCIACHEGCLKRIGSHKSLSCAVNPLAGDEEYLKISPAIHKKNALVIGGGISGMVSALTLAERGHVVSLIEKEDCLGGNLKQKNLPEFKVDYKKYIQYLERKLKNSSVHVVLSRKFSQEDIDESTDIVIDASGANFKTTNITGLNNSDILNPIDCYFMQPSLKGKRIILIGGGLIGVEAAINLAKQDILVTVIEKDRLIAKDAYKANRDHLIQLLDKLKVQILTDSEVSSFESNNAIVCVDKKDIIMLKFHKIAFCLGLESNSIGYMPSSGIKYLKIGDSEKPGKVIDAVWNAYRKSRLL